MAADTAADTAAEASAATRAEDTDTAEYDEGIQIVVEVAGPF